MASAAPPVVFHQAKYAEPQTDKSHHNRARLPVIPDLRFEYSYVRSVRPYVEVKRIGGHPDVSPTDIERVDEALLEQGYETLDATLGLPGKEKEEGFGEGDITVVQPSTPTSTSGPQEIIRVQWKKVLWVTLRDQVISPFLQGGLWALASYYITPFSAQLGSRLGTFVHQKLPAKEGSGVTWLRSWGKQIGLSNGGNNNISSKPSNLRYI